MRVVSQLDCDDSTSPRGLSASHAGTSTNACDGTISDTSITSRNFARRGGRIICSNAFLHGPVERAHATVKAAPPWVPDVGRLVVAHPPSSGGCPCQQPVSEPLS